MAFLHVSLFNVYRNANNKLGCSKLNNQHSSTNKFWILGQNYSFMVNNNFIHLDSNRSKSFSQQRFHSLMILFNLFFYKLINFDASFEIRFLILFCNTLQERQYETFFILLQLMILVNIGFEKEKGWITKIKKIKKELKKSWRQQSLNLGSLIFYLSILFFFLGLKFKWSFKCFYRLSLSSLTLILAWERKFLTFDYWSILDAWIRCSY